MEKLLTGQIEGINIDLAVCTIVVYILISQGCVGTVQGAL